MSKSYYIEISNDGDKETMRRRNDGFSARELLGLLEFIKAEILSQMLGDLKPERIKREVMVDDT